MSAARDRELDRREHVQPAHAPERLAKSWDRVRAAESRGPRPRRALLGAAAVAVAAAAALLVMVLAPRGEPSARTALRTEGEASQVQLEDGTTIDAEPHTELVVDRESADRTRVRLDRGGARFDVRPRAGREFVVAAGAVRVRVVGTRFTVARDRGDEHDHVRVSVSRGAVEVQHGDEVHRLEPGMRWENEARIATAPPEPELAPEPEHPPEPEPEATDQAPAEEPAEEARAESARARPAPRTGPSASELFARAGAARRDGDARVAAQHYDALVRTYPRDPRASLAAFELGRLRMDRLSDPAGAARALRVAIRLGRGSPFREDAMARLVRALDAAGREDACRGARERYLTAFPAGRYGNDVRRRCP